MDIFPDVDKNNLHVFKMYVLFGSLRKIVQEKTACNKILGDKIYQGSFVSTEKQNLLETVNQ